ncbi:MAG: EamA family transporter [Lachnospiraceae bacterium]|nr:EamA family transporter [Lachnospiraceae bacterium]
MKYIKDFVFLHLNICLFSFTGVFSKLASNVLNKNGIHSIMLYVYLGLMLLNCAVYALAWQRAIKKFDLSFAFANRSVYLIWSQLWAVLIFKEHLTVNNIIGMLFVLVGITVVQLASSEKNQKEEKDA